MLGKIKEHIEHSASCRKALFSLTLALSLLYLFWTAILLIILPIMQNRIIVLRPDYIFFLVFSLVILLNRNKKSIVLDFLPFIMLIVAYDAMRGYADDFATSVNYSFPINLDLALFGGTLPTNIVQQMVPPAFESSIGFISLLGYSLHFAVPLLFGFIIWLDNKESYFKYMILLLLVSYAALLTFWVFPSAPPWMASEQHLISIEHKLPVIAQNYNVEYVVSIYNFVKANPVAAIPSLHFAYPFIGLVFAISSKRWFAAVFFLFYSLVIGFSIVYLGEHYFTDILIAIFYVLILKFFLDWAIETKMLENIGKHLKIGFGLGGCSQP